MAAGRRSRFRGIRLRLALALLVVVAGSLGVVYLIVVPSLEAELVDAKLDQLEEDARNVARGYGQNEIGSEQEFAEQAASVFQARVVIYSILQNQPFIFGDSNTTSSLDVARESDCAACDAHARGSSAAPSSGGAGASPRWRFRSRTRAS